MCLGPLYLLEWMKLCVIGLGVLIYVILYIKSVTNLVEDFDE